jgi:hypothetical protein
MGKSFGQGKGLLLTGRLQSGLVCDCQRTAPDGVQYNKPTGTSKAFTVAVMEKQMLHSGHR